MSIEEYPLNLELFSQPKYIGKYLDDDSKGLLAEKAGLLRKIRQSRRGSGPFDWRFSISRDRPLTFMKSDIDGYKLQVDISCEIEGRGDVINKQNILLRVWSFDEDVCYREGLDAAACRDRVEAMGWKRVMVRFHFDLRNSNTEKPEPLFHLQAGGDAEGHENSWLHKKIDVPRFPYPPMDIILSCEFVLMNFFPKESRDLREKPEWKSLVKKSQELFQRPHLTTWMKSLNNDDDTLLGKLISAQ